jgi:hypothetical protein
MKRQEDIDITLAKKPMATMETKSDTCNMAVTIRPCVRVKPMGKLQPDTVHADLLKKLKLN